MIIVTWLPIMVLLKAYNKKNQSSNKSFAIPGYTGYLPCLKAENLHWMTYSLLSRHCFDMLKSREKPYLYSSTGSILLVTITN